MAGAWSQSPLPVLLHLPAVDGKNYTDLAFEMGEAIGARNVDVEGPGSGFFAFPAAEHSVMSFTVPLIGRVLAAIQTAFATGRLVFLHTVTGHLMTSP